MKKFLPFLLLSFLLFSCGKADRSKFSSYPKYRAVLKQMKEVNLVQDQKLSYSLAKKPEGWFLVKINKANYKPVAETQIWSSETKIFSRIPENFLRTADPTGDKFDLERSMGYQDYQYDHSVYFGYDGWEDDAVKELEGKDLTDTLYEALARAYSSKLTMIGVEKGKRNYEKKFFTDNEAAEFCEIANKSLAVYKKLLALNPDYETLIGKVKTKLSNEYVYDWSELTIKGRAREAEQFLVAGLYDDEFINYAKNMLMSAEKNGIIFTDGDNDTFPLWYIQAQMNYRPDVAVVNTSLMNIPEWIAYWKKKYNITLALSPGFYSDTTSEMIVVDKQDQKADFSELASGINSKSGTFFSSGTYIIPFHFLKLSMDRNNSGVDLVLTENHILRADICMLDIISSNYTSRKIYVPMTASHYSIEGDLLRNYEPEGMLQVLKNCETDTMAMMDPLYHLRKWQTNMKKYEFGLKQTDKFQSEQVAFNYAVIFNSLGTALLDKADTAGARETALQAYTMLPVDKMEDPVAAYLTGQPLALTHQDKEAKNMFQLCVDKCKIASGKSNDGSELRRFAQIMDYTKTICERSGYADLAANAERASAEIMKKAEKFPLDNSIHF